jgi:dTDP-L-rhamnose 4-epimerase
LTPDISRAAAAGFQPAVTLEDGLARYVRWLRQQGPVVEAFGESLHRLRSRRMVRQVAS